MLRHLILLLFAISLFSCRTENPTWPIVTNEAKPWTRWWWHGSSVTETGITHELESLQKAGIGGVEITPIYGVIGDEENFVPYLSERWVALLMHTIKEADRLGLGVDMATGTGWPFGGPWVSEDDAPKNLSFKTYTLRSGQQLQEAISYIQEPMVRAVRNQVYNWFEYSNKVVPAGTVPGDQANTGVTIDQLVEPISANKNLQGLALDQVKFEKPLPLVELLAYGPNGQMENLTGKVAPNGKLDWTAPDGEWTLFALFQGWHGKMVERAAPGGEGNVIDHFSGQALDRYLRKFDDAFKGQNLQSLRCFFNDSYEVDDARGTADWTPGLLNTFLTKKGYDLRTYLPLLLQNDTTEMGQRVRMDYREVISDLLLNQFTRKWDAWADGYHAMVRNQAHGSPANVLDLYATVDIPETEGINPLFIRFAASAGHVNGKKLVSSESATWLNDHFLSSLGDIRLNLERYLLNGVNHVLYHGTAYSPVEDAWPGRLFYAAIHMNDRNPFWQDAAKLNHYIARTQAFLQSSSPDNDILLYYPIHDRWAEADRSSLLAHFHGRGAEFDSSNVILTAQYLLQGGYTFDYISDAQIQRLSVQEGKIISNGGNQYKTILVPATHYMPLHTLEQLARLEAAGVRVLFAGGGPAQPTGLSDLENQQRLFAAAKSGMKAITGADWHSALEAAVTRETMSDLGISFIRKKYGKGHLYFLANRGETPFEGWLPLEVADRDAQLFDTYRNQSGAAQTRLQNGRLEVYLQLKVDETLVVQTGTFGPNREKFPFFQPKITSGPPAAYAGDWEVQFLSGGPTLPAVRKTPAGYWTEWPDSSAHYFSGTAEYKTNLPAFSQQATAWELNLGAVAQSAVVIWNDKVLDTLTGPDFRVIIPGDLIQPENELRIRVSNSMANRIIDLERRQVPYKRFYNINFPAARAENRNAIGLFDASGWQPLPSGLPNTVLLTPLEVVAEE